MEAAFRGEMRVVAVEERGETGLGVGGEGKGKSGTEFQVGARAIW